MKVAVVIPAYKVRKHILTLLERVGPEVHLVVVVDDKCPEESGRHVLENCADPRVRVVFNERNLGVGGAVKNGYRAAMADGADIMVKLDGDGQMDPALIPDIVRPILERRADYVKGNRFDRLETLARMPTVRLIGNSALSLVNKVVSGYWQVMDPTNGFTALHRAAAERLPLDKIDNRYFFESDMLFRLGVARAVVEDMTMDAFYGDEQSSLRVSKVLFEFPPKYFARFWKRLFYTYLLRDFNIASVEMLAGLPMLLFGLVYGAFRWVAGVHAGQTASAGTVMLAALPVLLGFQLLLSALNYDIRNTPSRPLCR